VRIGVIQTEIWTRNLANKKQRDVTSGLSISCSVSNEGEEALRQTFRAIGTEWRWRPTFPRLYLGTIPQEAGWSPNSARHSGDAKNNSISPVRILTKPSSRCNYDDTSTDDWGGSRCTDLHSFVYRRSWIQILGRRLAILNSFMILLSPSRQILWW
jgi:hypothetical protein